VIRAAEIHDEKTPRGLFKYSRDATIVLHGRGMSRIGVASIQMPRIMQSKSASAPYITLFTVRFTSGEAHRRRSRARKHISRQRGIAGMQSVLSRRRQHAISYVLARESMDRADRAEGILLIARAFARSFSPSSCSFPSLSLYTPPSLSILFFLSFSLSGSPSEKDFYGRNDFQFERKHPYLPLAVAFARAHRITADAIRNCHGEFAASLALNTRHHGRGNEPIRT